MAAAAAVIALIAGGTACDTIDSDRIPAVPVNIIFSTVATWDTYGVTGALDSRRFILTRTEREPRNFPYPASSSTGFGGVLLVCDYYGNPVAYDLACPACYERNLVTRSLAFSANETLVCPRCQRTYDLCNGGTATSGEGKWRLYRYQLSYANDLVVIIN